MGTARRIAVTGGSGRIGAFVVKELLDRGYDVINLDRRQAEKPLCRFVYANLAQRETVQPALENVDAVVHLGEVPNVNVGWSPEAVLAENVKIGSTVMQIAADLKLPRVVYASTCQVYGMWDAPAPAKPLHLPFDETHPTAPHNAYALSKVTNETYAKLLAEQHALFVAIFRLPWVPPWEFTPAWEATLRPKPTSTDGFGVYCHSTDVAKAFALALEKPRPGCEIYNLSAPEILSLHPLSDRLRAHHPDFPPLPPDWPPFKSPLISDKARQHFGWKPAWNALDFYRSRNDDLPLSF